MQDHNPVVMFKPLFYLIDYLFVAKTPHLSKSKPTLIEMPRYINESNNSDVVIGRVCLRE